MAAKMLTLMLFEANHSECILVVISHAFCTRYLQESEDGLNANDCIIIVCI